MDSQPTSSAATTIPFDVLQEIFSHCLPDSPLDEVQPNVKIAPMSLCHVCSSWRTGALESPQLWMYLYYRLPLHWESGPLPVAWDSKIFLRKMECLKWWRRNQGSRAPFIRFEFYQPQRKSSRRFQELPLTHDDIRFFVEYLALAQYLDVGFFARCVFQQDPIYSSPQVSCPDLQSLVTRYPGYFVPSHIAPKLRRLRIHDSSGHALECMRAFAHWSGLTHLSLRNMFMYSCVTWYSLIRAMPNLQWGYFDIRFAPIYGDYNPPKFTLPYLDTLSATLDDSHGNVEEEPLKRLLINLHFPALRDLSLYIEARPWSLPGVAMRINDWLPSAPAIKKLTLAFKFFRISNEVGNPQTSWEEVDKYSMLTPCLTHLALDVCYINPEIKDGSTLSRRLARWKKILPPMRWLDLENPASTLCKISVVVRDDSESSKDWPLIEGVIRDALKLDKAEKGTKLKVILEIIPEEKKKLALYTESYKTWGCSL